MTENEKWISVSVGCHNLSLLRFRLHLHAPPRTSPLLFHSFALAALTRIHHLAFSSLGVLGFVFCVFGFVFGFRLSAVRCQSVFHLIPCYLPASTSPSASAYLINYFKDSIVLFFSHLINLSKVQMKIGFHAASLFLSFSRFGFGIGFCFLFLFVVDRTPPGTVPFRLCLLNILFYFK